MYVAEQGKVAIGYYCWISSVIIVSDYEVLDQGSVSGRGKWFSFNLCVQTGSEVHPASYSMCPWGKARPGRDADHSPNLVPRSRMSRSCMSSTLPKRLHDAQWDGFIWLRSISLPSVQVVYQWEISTSVL
jgi:hypothetical protein